MKRDLQVRDNLNTWTGNVRNDVKLPPSQNWLVLYLLRNPVSWWIPQIIAVFWSWKGGSGCGPVALWGCGPVIAKRYVITGLVLKGLVWGRRWQVQVHFPLVGCWVRGWSSLAPLGCLLLGSDCQRRGVRNPSEESYSKDISKSADFFLQFSFMNLRFGETTFTCSDRSTLLK